MKLKLTTLLLLLPFMALAQFSPGTNVAGTLQRNDISTWVRYLQGSNSIRLALYSDIPTVTPVSFTAFGSTPNANGASVTSNVITLHPVNGSFSGGVTPTMYNTWNAKESALTFSTGLTRSTNTITINQAFTPTWTGLHTFAPSSGHAIDVTNSGSSIGVYINNTAPVNGPGLYINNSTSSSGDAFIYAKNSVTKFKITDGGNIEAPLITSSSLTNGLVGSTSGTLGNITALPSGTTATTQTAGNNTTLVATTAFVTTAVTAGGSGYMDLTTAQTVTTGIKTFTPNIVVNGLYIGGKASGTQNTLVGGSIGASMIAPASSNSIFGHGALSALTSGSQNVSVGVFAGQNLTTGGSNTFVGNSTGGGITTGSNNTIIGGGVGSLATGLSGNVILSDGAGNIRAQHNGTTWTLGSITSPTLVTPVLGVATGTSLALSGALSATTGGFTSTVTIARSGNQALNLRNGTASDRMQIFVGDGTSGFTADENYILNNNTDLNVTNTGGGVQLVNGATSWSAISDENTKVMTEFKPFKDALNKVNSLRAGTTRYKTDAKGVSRSFLIAQDVQKVLPEAVSIDKNGELNLRYSEVIPLLVGAIKELKAEIELLKNK